MFGTEFSLYCVCILKLYRHILYICTWRYAKTSSCAFPMTRRLTLEMRIWDLVRKCSTATSISLFSLFWVRKCQREIEKPVLIQPPTHLNGSHRSRQLDDNFISRANGKGYRMNFSSRQLGSATIAIISPQIFFQTSFWFS